MKRCLYLLPLLTGLILTSCYDEEIEQINGRLDSIENSQIATISQQITSINNSILLLNNTDKELGEYIAALETEAEKLQTQITATNTKIDEVKTEILSTISSEKANILAELEAFKATVNGELDAIKAVLETLKAKDAELDGKIATLQEYVDTELKATEDWATATFSTLEQYNEVVATIATIEGTIEGINESIAALETRINEKIAKDIETACVTLSADLQNAVKEVTEAYTSAIATAKNELTEAYTTALEGAISALETSMKAWVNEQLTAYSTIVSTEAKITALQSEMDGKLAAQKTYLEALVNALSSSVTTDITAIKKQIEEINETIAKNAEEIEALRGELAEQKAELTEAYTNAIDTAIATNNGEIEEKIATEIQKVNDKINALTQRVATLEQTVSNISTRLEDVENDIVDIQEQLTSLVNRIQSISYIPQYSDGKATIDTDKKIGVFDFKISPKDAIDDLANVWETALTMEAVHTQTRAVSFIELPITYFKADVNNGTFSIEIDATNLGDNFFSGEIEASVALNVSDGNNNLASTYINLALGTVKSLKNTPDNNEIWYTASTKIYPYKDNFGASVVSNNWDSTTGKGVITFREDVTRIGDHAFYECRKLTNITIPESVKLIGDSAFSGCGLRGINMPNNISSIGSSAFYNCSNLVDISIPNSVSSIGFAAFYNCHKLTTINIPYGITNIEGNAFSGCNNLTDVKIPDSVTNIGSWSFYECWGITSITIPDGVVAIGDGAFQYCENLASVTIGKSVNLLGTGVFYNCESLAAVYCKATTPPNAQSSIVSSNVAPGIKIYVPNTSVNIYKTTRYWSDHADSIIGCNF